MAIKINGKDLAKRIINGQEVQKVMLNGSQIRPTEIPPVDDYLCFTANTSGSTLQLHSTINWKNTALEISYDKETWQSYTIDPLNHYPLITLSNVGDKVYFRNQSTTPVVFSEPSQYNNTYYYFTMSGSIAASGDINYLLCKETTTTLTGS